MKIFFIGDIVGRTGRKAVRELLPDLKRTNQLDLIIANGENAAGGFGLTSKVAEELFGYGIDCLTMGNHTWDNKDIFNFIDKDNRIVRPLNYNQNLPGRGWTTFTVNNHRVAIINLLGNVFMNGFNCPFSTFNLNIANIKKECKIALVDFHAEATGEKLAFANYVDGRVSCVVGTHTHIQTADERILPAGTGYITDLGLTGAVDSVLGMSKDSIIKKFITGIPQRFNVASGQYQLEGLIVNIKEDEGITTTLKRISLKS